MPSTPWAPPSQRWRWLQISLLISHLLHLTSAQFHVSTFQIRDIDTLISINLPPNSDDINFFFTASQNFNSYAAIGFGDDMSDSLMLVMHRGASGSNTILSPRRATGHAEPVHDPSIQITFNPFHQPDAQDLRVNGTCHSCRSLIRAWSTSRTSTDSSSENFLPMIYAFGPNEIFMKTDDLDAPLRRHVGHGKFSIDANAATGPGGVGPLESPAINARPGGDVHVTRTSNKVAVVHGALFVVAAMVFAPFDMMAAAFLKRWPKVQTVSGAMYLGFALGAFVPGVLVSRQHIMTQKFATGHQILGLLAFILLLANFMLGAGLGYLRKRNDDASKSTSVMDTAHLWTGRLIWVLLLVSGGLGLKLSLRRTLFILGYAALAGAIVVLLAPVYFVLWRCTRARKSKEAADEHELQDSIYNHWHNR
ncbi:hypothetical protein QBC42DRAFT_235509 [Cladorrhinum samala]|uniref:Cellobiose dehydrogenase-like cytochrome domain-containing protein n=1 Tax=Cladorrhinum samala TaxID=585594 RepID=A0AAV9HCX7_9PEZI|nr:hypothetical protein QBC42DRAFT_235509 [Cladorrhinum samala]